jgi:hypothetical protein
MFRCKPFNYPITHDDLSSMTLVIHMKEDDHTFREGESVGIMTNEMEKEEVDNNDNNPELAISHGYLLNSDVWSALSHGYLLNSDVWSANEAVSSDSSYTLKNDTRGVVVGYEKAPGRFTSPYLIIKWKNDLKDDKLSSYPARNINTRYKVYKK